MAWETISAKELALRWGINHAEVEEKIRLIKLIIKTRKAQNMSQAVLAKKAKVTQSRIAQIEVGVGTKKVTFDVLINLLNILGYTARITLKKAA